eukprot:CAMPEP_0205818744 /NCGR_PEP_ID=MMETSP0206-20130828/776_1 /ASSEMBLY_ACC=CAM_ASM_000279 /TAXON_ID=36767 /ORGANISM="Euplotes focardii, Strain TN1" /LENGTH=100 /DNA_ID=CAMNT_0053111435 /DNA_START=19 /DNA_END=318 /DNA_ORIENTATION=+
MDQDQNTKQPMMGGPAQPTQGYPQPIQDQPVPGQQPTQYGDPVQPQYQGIPQQPMPNGEITPKATPAMFRGVVNSVFCECPSCGQATHTRVELQNSPIQW